MSVSNKSDCDVTEPWIVLAWDVACWPSCCTTTRWTPDLSMMTGTWFRSHAGKDVDDGKLVLDEQDHLKPFLFFF